MKYSALFTPIAEKRNHCPYESSIEMVFSGDHATGMQQLSLEACRLTLSEYSLDDFASVLYQKSTDFFFIPCQISLTCCEPRTHAFKVFNLLAIEFRLILFTPSNNAALTPINIGNDRYKLCRKAIGQNVQCSKFRVFQSGHMAQSLGAPSYKSLVKVGGGIGHGLAYRAANISYFHHFQEGSTRDEKCQVELAFKSISLFVGCNTYSYSPSSYRSDCCHPVGPFGDAQTTPVTDSAPRDPHPYCTPSDDYGSNRSQGIPNYFPVHSSSNFSWRNRNTASIGGGK